MSFSFTLKDNEIYYLVFLDKCYINVNAFEIKDEKFYEIENENIKKLINYFNDYVYSKRCWHKFIDLELSLNYKIPQQAKKKLGDKFCRFIRDYDLHCLHQDINAKHFIPNWNAIEKNEQNFFIQPKLFPFYISYLDVMIDKNYNVYYKNQKIKPDEVFEIENEYKKSLIPLIKKKDKVYQALMNDLENKYYKTKKFLKSINLWDYNLDGHIEFFDIAGNAIFEEWIHFETYDLDPCSLKLYGLDIDVSYIFWRLIDAFGLRIVTAKIDVWSEVKTDLQMSYKI